MICKKCNYDKAVLLFASVACDRCDGRLTQDDILSKRNKFLDKIQAIATRYGASSVAVPVRYFREWGLDDNETYKDLVPGVSVWALMVRANQELVRVFPRKGYGYPDYLDLPLSSFV